MRQRAPRRPLISGLRSARTAFGKLVFATLLENGERLQLSARKTHASPECFEFVKRLE